MKTVTFRISGTDYLVNNLICDTRVRVTSNEDKKGKEYNSKDAAIASIQNEEVSGYTKHILTIAQVKEMSENQEFNFNLRVWECAKNNQGDYKKTGFVVIHVRGTLANPDRWKVAYHRGHGSAEACKVEKPECIDTTNFDQSAMFFLNHGMSEERWMST